MGKADILRRVDRVTIHCDSPSKDRSPDTLVFTRVEVEGKLKFIQLIPTIHQTCDTLLTRETMQSMIDALQEMIKN